VIRGPSGWIAGLPPDSVTMMGLSPESRATFAITASAAIGAHVARYSASTACRLSHQSQR
jgi:hypothetical protein